MLLIEGYLLNLGGDIGSSVDPDQMPLKLPEVKGKMKQSYVPV